MELDGIDHVALSVRDLERSAQWYIDVLGFERRYQEAWNGVPTFLGKGSTAIALFPAGEGVRQDQPNQDEGGILHLAFRADAGNFAAARKELNERGIKFTFEDHEISHSIYFRSPDGHKFEITTYELA
jgi:catechol 2,3-dioxygenase-like lactoylglutathione lyase family enzyme